MSHSFDETIWFSIIFFFSKRVAFFQFGFLDSCSTEGPTKSLLSVCLSVSSAFFSGMGCYFFLIFCTIIDNRNILKLTKLLFPGKFIFPKFGQKESKMAPKIGFFDFLKNFVISCSWK